ncbi:hypothetical protein FB45DRAFT_1050367 [Roridomyces roridus]|uniref:Uncharacterized protein n=1 Tax=Roridomyces roridus TaxID=1738132 RepID=A0AAD7CJ41_9AGAR|nr:hypothetical protein FB45DRAFT_1050367 [Roridomyces roridus]
MSAIEAEVNANIMEAEPVEVPVPSEVDALDVKEFMKETTHTDSTLPDSHDASAVASATEEGAGQVADNAVEEIANDDTNILTPAHSEGTKVNGDAVPAIETEAASDTMQDASAIPETPIIVTPQDPATSVAEPEHATEQVEQIERPPSPWTPSYSVTTQGLGTPTSEVPPPVAPETTLDATPATEEDAAEELATPAETAELLAEVSDQSDVIPDIKVEDISETTVPPVSEGEVETTDSAPVVVEPEPEVAQDASSSPASATEEVGVEETTGAEVEALLQDTKVDEPEVPSVAEVAAVEDVRGVAPEETAPEAVQAEVETTDSAPVVVEPEPEAAAPAPVSSAEEAVVEETSGAEVEALLQDTNADEPEVPSVAEVAADVEDVREVTPEETSTEAVLAEVETTDSTPVVVEPEPEAAAAAPVSSAEEAVIEETAAAEGEVLIQDTMADEPSVAEVATVDDVHKVTPEETSTEAVLAEVETIDAAPGFVEPEVVSNPSAVDEVVVEETTTPSVGAEVEALIQDTEADEMEVPPAADLVEDVPEAIPAADVVTEDIPVADETAAQEDAVVEDSSATAVPEDQVTTTEAAPVEPATIPTTEDVTPEDPVSAVEEAVVQEALPPSVEAEVAAEETKADVTTDTLSVRHVAEDSTATAVAEEELVKPELHLNDTAVEEILDVAAPEIVSVAENPAFEDESTEEPLRTDVLSTAHEGEVERPKSPWTPSYSVTTQGPGIPTVDELEAADLPVLPPPVEVMAPAPSEEDPVSDGTDLSAFVVAEAEPEAVSSPDIQVEIPADTLSATREEEMERPKSPWTPSYSVTTQGPEIPSSEELETADLPVLSPPTTSEDVVPVAEETQDETTESEVFQEPHVAPIPVPEVSEESAQASVADAETPLADDIVTVETTGVEASEDVVEAVETAGTEAAEDDVDEVAEPAETQPLQLSIPQEPEIDRPKSPWTPSYTVTTQGPGIPSAEELEAADLPVLSPTEDLTEEVAQDVSLVPTESEPVQEPESVESEHIPAAEAEASLTEVAAGETAGADETIAETADNLSIPQEQEIDRPKSPWTPSYSVTTQGPGIPTSEELEAADLPVLPPPAGESSEDAITTADSATQEDAVAEVESDAVQQEDLVTAAEEVSVVEEAQIAQESVPDVADAVTDDAPGVSQETAASEGVADEETSIAAEAVLDDADVTADQVPAAPVEDAAADIQTTAVDEVSEVSTSVTAEAVPEDADITTDQVREVPADSVEDADVQPIAVDDAVDEVSASVAADETNIVGETVPEDADIAADQVPEVPVDSAEDAEVQPVAVDAVVDEVSASVATDETDIIADQVSEAPVEDAASEPVAADTTVDEVLASVAVDETNVAAEAMPEDADITVDQVFEIPVAADVVEEISTPVAADEVEALTSVEVETPEYAPEELTDESLAVPAGEIERPKSPWTPSYSVTTQGPGIPTAEELEVADLPVLPPPVQIIADTSEPEPTVTVTSVDAETAPSSDPPRPWTPSYSVVVQGSPLSTPVDLVPQEPVSEAVSIDGEVSEAEPSSSPVASLIESGVIVDPATLQDPDVENDSPDPGSEAVVAALIESGVLGDVPQEQIAETTEKMLDDAVTESAATEVDVEVATEEPLVDTVPEPSGGATEVVIPEATSAQEASTLEEIAASEDSVTQDIVEPESSESTTLEALAAGAVVEAEGVAEEPQLLAPREPEIERPKSPWTPSYSVTTQGPGIPTAEELEAADLSTLPPPATEAVAADIEEQQAPTETLVEAPAIVLEDKAPADSLSPQEPEPERPKSPWTPSYSVTTQGPGIPTTEELDAAELPVLPPPVEATAPPAEDTSAFPLVAAGVAAVAATAVIAETAIATTAEHSKREEAEQAKEIPAPAQADESVAEETPASSGEPFVKPPVDEESVSVSVEPPADTPVNDATPIAPPVPLPELRPFPSTLEIPSADAEEVDDLPPVSPRSRLESTASSIFFPGGWFSKPSPPPVPSPSLAAEEQSEEKKGKWCVVM